MKQQISMIDSQQSPHSQRLALLLMSSSVISHSSSALLMDIARKQQVLILGGTAVAVLGLMRFVTVSILNRGDRNNISAKTAWGNISTSTKMLTVGFSASWLWFAWSVRYVEAAVTAVVFEVWVVILVLLRMFGPLRSGRRRIAWPQMLLIGAAFTGVALVIFSDGSTGEGSHVAVGVLFAALASLSAALFTALTLHSGEQTAAKCAVVPHPRHSDFVGERRRVVLFKIKASFIIGGYAQFSVGLAVLAYGLLAHRSGPTPFNAIALGAAVGLALFFSGGCLTAANHVTSTEAINALAYAVPVLSLGWLWLFTDVTVARPTLLLVGVLIVVAASVSLWLSVNRANRRAPLRAGLPQRQDPGLADR